MNKLIDIVHKIMKVEDDNNLTYGTAGFRYDSEIILEKVAPKVALLSYIICLLEGWNKLGIMITASHNPVNDNGLKFVNPIGYILNKTDELVLNKLINCSTDTFDELIDELADVNKEINLIIGYDLRPSSVEICDVIIKNISDKIKPIIVGVTTTPELHVKTINHKFKYADYYTQRFNSCSSLENKKLEITIDCANGAGSLVMQEFKCKLNHIFLNIINNDKPEFVNDMCGSDYVYTNRNAPTDFPKRDNLLGASLDGDADRLICYYYKKNEFRLFDGDKIGCLFALFIVNALSYLPRLKPDIVFVQTAYANASSTIFLNKVLKIPTICVPTGVKHLHKEAGKHDIGIYFEANGHGTVLFSNNFIRKIKKYINHPPTELSGKKINALEQLMRLHHITNQLIGDGISLLLGISFILLQLNLNLDNWHEIYKEVPSHIYKCHMNNRNLILTNATATLLVQPAGFAKRLERLKSCYNNFRIVIRPSGTEPVIRVYIETEKEEDINLIKTRITKWIEHYDMNR